MAITLLVLTVTSCKKDKKDEPTPVAATVETKTQLLTGKNWKLTAATSDPAFDWDGSGTMVTNIYAQMASCEKDDLLFFNTNGTLKFDEGATKCDPTDPQSTSDDTWSFNSTETIITVSSGDDMNLVSLNSTTLKVSSVLVEGGINYTITYTFTKQ